MAIAAGVPRPPVYIVPDPDPNAFATGRGPGHSSIAVTRGLLDALDREELQGVVAHEMSHVKNLDVRLMTIVAALVERFGREFANRAQENRDSSQANALGDVHGFLRCMN